MISGGGDLVKDTAASTLTLSGVSTFDGPLHILAGDLDLSGGWTPASGSAYVTVATGSFLQSAESFPAT